MSETIIARFSPVAVWTFTAIRAVVLTLGWILVALYPDVPNAASYALGTKEFIGLLFVCTLFMVWGMASLLWHLFRHGGRAVWIENGQLKFIDPSGIATLRSLTVADIQDLSIKTFLLRSSQVAIRMKRGSLHYISTSFSSASAGTIRTCLAEALSPAKLS